MNGERKPVAWAVETRFRDGETWEVASPNHVMMEERHADKLVERCNRDHGILMARKRALFFTPFALKDVEALVKRWDDQADAIFTGWHDRVPGDDAKDAERAALRKCAAELRNTLTPEQT